jgi:hypothetical protein
MKVMKSKEDFISYVDMGKFFAPYSDEHQTNLFGPWVQYAER